MTPNITIDAWRLVRLATYLRQKMRDPEHSIRALEREAMQKVGQCLCAADLTPTIMKEGFAETFMRALEEFAATVPDPELRVEARGYLEHLRAPQRNAAVRNDAPCGHKRRN